MSHTLLTHTHSDAQFGFHVLKVLVHLLIAYQTHIVELPRRLVLLIHQHRLYALKKVILLHESSHIKNIKHLLLTQMIVNLIHFPQSQFLAPLQVVHHQLQ